MTQATWDQTWMKVALAMSERSKCVRATVGCVIVSADQRVISSAYNGPPAGFPAEGPCSDWCPRAQAGGGGSPTYDDCHAVHSETNAIIRADHQELRGATVYVTSSICKGCAKVVANSGVTRVVHIVDDEVHWYRNNSETEQFLVDCGLEIVRWKATEDNEGDQP